MKTIIGSTDVIINSNISVLLIIRPVAKGNTRTTRIVALQNPYFSRTNGKSPASITGLYFLIEGPFSLPWWQS